MPCPARAGIAVCQQSESGRRHASIIAMYIIRTQEMTCFSYLNNPTLQHVFRFRDGRILCVWALESCCSPHMLTVIESRSFGSSSK